MDDRERTALDGLHPIERELVARERAAAEAGTPLTVDQLRAEHEAILVERHERLARDAHASWRAMEGWRRVESLEQWQETVQKAADELENGGFLLDRLGAMRYLDPELMAMLLVLRRRLIDEHGATTAAEFMLIDSAILAYCHQLRIKAGSGTWRACSRPSSSAGAACGCGCGTATGARASCGSSTWWSGSGSSCCRCWIGRTGSCCGTSRG